MRKIRSATLVLFVLVSQPWNWAYAYEIKNNPDRRLSFGLGYDRSEGTTDYSFRSFHMNDFSKQYGDSFIADIRAPLASFLTLTVRGSAYKNHSDLFTTEKLESNGYSFGGSLRFFIP